MNPMICIDFGNSYTKVALRTDRTSVSALGTDASLTHDQGNFCIPTVAANWRRAGSEKWHYGTNVITLRNANRSEYRIFRNWKPFFFEGTETSIHTAVPVYATATADRANGLSEEKWNQVKDLFGLTDDKRAAFEDLMSGNGQPSGNGQVKAEATNVDYEDIGRGYFHWLREFIRPICLKRGLGDIEDIPTRITLPSFGNGTTKAEMQLRKILQDTGWRLDFTLPALAEPLANTIGIFSEGVNATHLPKRQRDEVPNFGVMFYNTGLLHAMREASLANGPKSSWVLVADLGGYTFDLAMIGLDLQDLDGKIGGTLDGMPRFAMHSEPIGVALLDKRVKEALDPAKKKVFEEIETDLDQLRLGTVHKILYGKGRGVRVGGATFGQGDEGTRLKASFHKFGTELADCVDKFLDIHQFRRIDDMIVTGGGGMIPFVRNALRRQLEVRYGIRKFHFLAENGPKIHKLDEVFVRGATALGGTSVFFDFSE